MSDDAHDQPPTSPDSAPADMPEAGMSKDGPAVAPVLTRLVAEHHVTVYRYAFRLTGSSADAEDVTQQTFLIAQQKLDQVRDAERVGHWLLAVARNVFLKTRRRSPPLSAANLDIDVNSLPDPATTETNTDEAAIEPEKLQAAIDELPDEFRIPVLMFYFEEASYRDIAEQLDVPPGTVMSRLSRAKSHLRRRLLKTSQPNPKPPENGRNAHPTPERKPAKY